MNPAPQVPRPRFIATLLAVAALVLAAGASLRPRAKQAAVAVPTNELATLPERSQRRALRDMAEYVRERSTTLGASVVFLPEYRASGLVVGRDSVLSVVPVNADSGPAAEAIRVVLTPPSRLDSAAPAAPLVKLDTLWPKWAMLVARDPNRQTLTLTGMTGGLIDAECGDLGIRELVFNAVVPAAFAGGALFNLDGNGMALAVPCSGRIALVPLADLTRLLQLQATPEHRLWTRIGFRVRAADSVTAEVLGIREGLVVTDLLLGSAADRAGLRPGDQIVGLGTRRVDGIEDLAALLDGRGGLIARRDGGRVALSSSPAGARSLAWVPSRLRSGLPLPPVPPGSRAAQAGLRTGDNILRIGRLAPTAAGLRRVLADTGLVFVVYQRDGRQRGVLLQ